jgi:hypothetical protein
MNENESAALDETFFGLMDGLFSRGFSALAVGMLAENDDETDVTTRGVERRASMGRHPSGRRRF